MKISISPTNHHKSNSGSSRFFKSAVLCALAYAFGLSSSRDFANNNSLVMQHNDRMLASNNHRGMDNSGRRTSVVSEQPWSAKARAKTPRKAKSHSLKANANKQSSEPASSSNTIPSALNLIPNDQLKLLDYFSDSWLLNKKNFLKVPLSQIGIVEDACLAAIGKRQIHDHSKMFVDWTDFMVMHLSKWWNELNILGDGDSTMFDHTTGTIFGGYLKKILGRNRQPANKSPLHPTIAMIAFAPYRSSKGNRAEVLTAHALASTVASLYQVGFGRVIVTCNGISDVTRVHEAFRLVHLYATATDGVVDDINSIFNSVQIPTQIGNTELAAVRITNTTWFKTKWVKHNMPLAAVIGMQLALGGKFEYDKETRYWLGTKHDASYWKYVYLTEPDTLLHTKESMWKPIQEGLDQGLSFFPHRLQPLPHELNLPPSADDDPSNNKKKKHISKKYESKFIPNNVPPFSNVTNLDESRHCCDDGPEWPGRSEEFGIQQRPCGGHWWWGCGYQQASSSNKPVLDQTKEEVLENHKRLIPYPMMTISKGTGIVFAPTEMGRRCLPSRDPCKRSDS
mmetsp:Transcript_40812/g.98423  ORF Transcript_40812/g.98423 Transcript_40812/m.98423 type:complete len:566 (+) Transcript_40812:40-1737(+)